MKNLTPKELKDDEVKIGTPEEAFWSNVELKTNMEIKALNDALKFNEAVKLLAQQKLAEEKLRQQE